MRGQLIGGRGVINNTYIILEDDVSLGFIVIVFIMCETLWKKRVREREREKKEGVKG